jgi:carbon storage regulator
MLVLSRKVGERIWIGDDISITVVRITGGGVRLGIEAPSEMPVVREELKLKLEQSVVDGEIDVVDNSESPTTIKFRTN